MTYLRRVISVLSLRKKAPGPASPNARVVVVGLDVVDARASRLATATTTVGARRCVIF